MPDGVHVRTVQQCERSGLYWQWIVLCVCLSATFHVDGQVAKVHHVVHPHMRGAVYKAAPFMAHRHGVAGDAAMQRVVLLCLLQGDKRLVDVLPIHTACTSTRVPCLL